MLMNLKKDWTLSTEIEYYQEIWSIPPLKKNERHFKTLSLFSKLILVIFGVFVFICRASRICNRSLFISCVIIVVFSTRIFRNLDLEIEWVLRAIGYRARIIKVNRKLSWKGCIVKANIRIIFFGDTVSQGTFEHIYDVCPIKKFSGGGRVIGNN